MNEQFNVNQDEISPKENEVNKNEDLQTTEKGELKEIIQAESEEKIKEKYEEKKEQAEDLYENLKKGIDELYKFKRAMFYDNVTPLPGNPDIMSGTDVMSGKVAILDKGTLAPISDEYEKILTGLDGKVYGEKKRLGGLMSKIEEIELKMRWAPFYYSKEIREMLKDGDSKIRA